MGASLNELLIQQTKKDIAVIRQGLSDKSLANDARIALHTLKGDLASVRGKQMLELLASIKAECEEVFGGKFSDQAELLLDRLESLVENLSTPENSKAFKDEDGKTQLQKRFEATAERIGEGLDKEINLNCSIKLSDPPDKLLGFISKALTPLLVNSCVHGTAKKGEVQIDIAEENGDIHLSISDDGALDGKRELSPEEKLYAGDGLGVDGVRMALEKIGGSLEVHKGKRRVTQLRFKRSLEA